MAADRHAQRMIETIRSHALASRHVLAQQTIDAIERVPRHLFVPAAAAARAYDDCPLSIGHGQTISQPFMVALMTDLLQLDATSHVLEIGCGCGYQTAILAELAASVHAVEIVPELASRARKALGRLGCRNVEVTAGDGFLGWPGSAPYDAILAAAAAIEIPAPLIDQLKCGGRMVLPLGRPAATQRLILATKISDSDFTAHDIMPVRFVPLTRTGGASSGD